MNALKIAASCFVFSILVSLSSSAMEKEIDYVGFSCELERTIRDNNLYSPAARELKNYFEACFLLADSNNFNELFLTIDKIRVMFNIIKLETDLEGAVSGNYVAVNFLKELSDCVQKCSKAVNKREPLLKFIFGIRASLKQNMPANMESVIPYLRKIESEKLPAVQETIKRRLHGGGENASQISGTPGDYRGGYWFTLTSPADVVVTEFDIWSDDEVDGFKGDDRQTAIHARKIMLDAVKENKIPQNVTINSKHEYNFINHDSIEEEKMSFAQGFVYQKKVDGENYASMPEALLALLSTFVEKMKATFDKNYQNDDFKYLFGAIGKFYPHLIIKRGGNAPVLDYNELKTAFAEAFVNTNFKNGAYKTLTLAVAGLNENFAKEMKKKFGENYSKEDYRYLYQALKKHYPHLNTK